MSSRSNNRATGSRSSSARSRHSARMVAQASIDAKLHADFEQSDQPLNYSNSNDPGNTTTNSSVSAYLQQMQRSKYIQPFGCLLAIEDQKFTVIAYSENALEMLDLAPHAVPSIDQHEVLSIGTDVRTLFKSPSAMALQKATTFSDVNLLNPILVHCKSSGKPFYAIVHRAEAGLVIDLEPVNPADVPVTAAGALKSYKLAAKAISRLQSLPSGNISLLCDVLVRELGELTGYDRVMAYKFHEDEHGEVIAECRRSDLEPYIGLHYPATDIPQASRFLFMKNKVRMICDCRALPVQVIQDKKLYQPLNLCGSTLRAPHGCHAQYMSNMGSIASLVMAVTINEDEDDEAGSDQKARKLWGLVVCHHTSPRFIPFPLRYACEFLLQVFGIQLNKEVELAAQAREKHILRTQTVLCDMLLRDAPLGIFNQSPNVMDIVKCDGAALYYKNMFFLLGTTPTESQIRDIASWLIECHNGSTGLSTDSLFEAGYPSALALGNSVCGMAAIKITDKDFIFWFRSHTAKEIKWGGAKHEPSSKDDGDQKLHPRSSFREFLEVVKWRSLPWEDVEMDSIHSLQLILRGSLNADCNNSQSKTLVKTSPSDDMKNIQGVDELRSVTNEMVRLIETATVPILAVDGSGNINGWNTKASELTGLSVEDAIGMPLVDVVDGDSIDVAKTLLACALQGKEEQNVEIKLKKFGHNKHNGPVVLIVNACSSRDMSDRVTGACFVGQDVTGHKLIMDKYTRIQGDYNAVVKNPHVLVPPIFMINEHGSCMQWNAAMQKLSGLNQEDAINKMLVGEVFDLHGTGVRVKDQDTLTKLRILLNNVIAGREADDFIFGIYDKKGKFIEALLLANKRVDSEGRIIGALCFLHVASPELQQALQMQKRAELAANNSLKELEHLRQEIRNPLNGILFTQRLMLDSEMSREQKKLLHTRTLCQDQLMKILDDMDLESIEQSYLEINTVDFNLGEAVEAAITQGKVISKERQVTLVHDLPTEISSMHLYGDNLRLQQVLAEFIVTSVQFTPPAAGAVQLRVIPRMQQIGIGVHIVHLEFRIVHPAPGIPEGLVQEMFRHSQGISREGLGLYISQKLVKIMNGTVQYLREAESSTFIVLVEFPLVKQSKRRIS